MIQPEYLHQNLMMRLYKEEQVKSWIHSYICPVYIAVEFQSTLCHTIIWSMLMSDNTLNHHRKWFMKIVSGSHNSNSHTSIWFSCSVFTVAEGDGNTGGIMWSNMGGIIWSYMKEMIYKIQLAVLWDYTAYCIH